MSKQSAPANNVVDLPIQDALSERYLSYALSTIMSRSLPDVRDGLKPVHRRLLYAMHELKLNPEGAPKKCARVVGDVIGKYHPHGDQAVYDALVRLAQDFAVRYPLIDGQGNFGNIDGDNAAAMRYTESRMTATALRLLEGIEEDAIDFRATYDGEDSEPVVLPANFPNLLANGASGIAVGMATNIPPHNVSEICDGLLLMLEEGDPDIKKLVRAIPGPDFPTGGILVEDKDNIVEAYRTGKGAFRLRAKWEKEDLKQGQYQIVVTEIPYQLQKAKLIEKIAEMIHARKIPLLDDIIDESAEDVRIVLVPKNRNVEPDILMEALFRNSDLETRFNMNLNVLENGTTPRVMPLGDILRSWLDHRQQVLIRRSNHRLEKVKHRIEVLDGYLVVYLNIDEVIQIIRESDEPKQELIDAFGLSEVQAEAVLNMRLRSLRKLEEIEIKKEHDSLSKEKAQLEKLIKSESAQWDCIRGDIEKIKEDYSKKTPLGRRRTELGKAPKPVAVDLDEAMIEKEPITFVCSEKGWVRAMKGHGINPDDLKYKDGDAGQFVMEVMTTDKLLILGSNGRFFTLGCDKLPPGRGFGEPLRIMIDLPNESHPVAILRYEPGQQLMIARSDGKGFRVKSDDVLAQTKSGKQIVTVDKKASVHVCKPIAQNDDHIAVIGENRKLLIFPLEEVPELSKGMGVILQKYKDGGLSDFKTFNMEDGFTFPYGSGMREVEDLTAWLGKRAQTGRMPPNGFPRNNKFE